MSLSWAKWWWSMLMSGVQSHHFEFWTCLLQRTRCCQTRRSGEYTTGMARRDLSSMTRAAGGGGPADIFSQCVPGPMLQIRHEHLQTFAAAKSSFWS